MALTASDLILYESTNGRGGVITANVVSEALNGLFPEVQSGDSYAGQDFYRCIYLKNTGAQTLLNAGAKILADTNSTSTYIRIAKGTSTYPAAESTIPNDVTAPVGVTWQGIVGAIVNLGNLAANESVAIWVHRNVAPGTVAINADAASIQVFGDTLE